MIQFIGIKKPKKIRGFIRLLLFSLIDPGNLRNLYSSGYHRGGGDKKFFFSRYFAVLIKQIFRAS